jgi:protein-disulfide isomerase
MQRRRFLAVAGLGTALGTAGCIGSLGSDSGEGTTDAPERTDSTGDDDGEATDDGSSGARPGLDHPSAADLAAQPRLGEFGGHVVVAFEDPSCPRCAAFEQRTVPEVREKLVEPGKAAFVFRNYPVVYPWGEPASHALEATFARDEGAFWSLAEHYFTRQSTFSTDNVLGKTEAFLDDETGLDGGAVREDTENEAYADAVETDLEAGRDAEIGRTTPVVLLFRDGEYVTQASGSVSYDVIASALGEG